MPVPALVPPLVAATIGALEPFGLQPPSIGTLGTVGIQSPRAFSTTQRRIREAAVPTIASVVLDNGSVEPWRDVLAARASRLSRLLAGWDGPKSIAIDRGLIYRATALVVRAIGDLPNVTSPYLVPIGDGSLQIEWHTRDGEIELSMGVDGSLAVWVKDHRSGMEYEADADASIGLFFRWAPRIAAQLSDARNVPRQARHSFFEIAI